MRFNQNTQEKIHYKCIKNTTFGKIKFKCLFKKNLLYISFSL